MQKKESLYWANGNEKQHTAANSDQTKREKREDFNAGMRLAHKMLIHVDMYI